MNLKFYLCIVLATLMTACTNNEQTKTKHTPLVKVAVAQSANEDVQWQYPAHVKASSEVTASFKVAGNLKQVMVKEGQRVSKGQVIAIIDDSDYRIQLAATEAEYANIKADVERVTALYNEGAATATQYDKARYGLQQIEAKLNNHRNQVEYCRLKAPISGVIQTKIYNGGEVIAAGMPVVQIVSSGAPQVEIAVPAQVYTRLNHVSEVSAQFNAMGNQTYHLAVVAALPRANATGLYEVQLSITEGGELPSPGMNGWVTLSVDSKCMNETNEVFVPSTALVHNDTEDYIFKIKDNTVTRIPVSVTNLTADGRARVSGKIQAGEQIVTSGVHSIKDGEQVEILKPASRTNVGGMI